MPDSALLLSGYCFTAVLQAGVALPSALGGMLGLTGLLMLFGPRAGDEMVKWYDTHLGWTSQLLPLFYVPALAVLPVFMHGMPGEPYESGHAVVPPISSHLQLALHALKCSVCKRICHA